MQHTHIEGLVALLKQFENAVEDVRIKPYNLLDFDKTQFDRDFLEFNVRVNDLELALQVIYNPRPPNQEQSNAQNKACQGSAGRAQSSIIASCMHAPPRLSIRVQKPEFCSLVGSDVE